MFTEEAEKILELDGSENFEILERSYLKLIKRYPPEFFPEKSLLLRKAYSVLNQDKEFWRNILDGKEKASLGKKSPFIIKIKKDIFS